MKQSISTWIRRQRKDAGMSQARLADTISEQFGDVSQSLVSKWEQAKTIPDAQQREALETIFEARAPAPDRDTRRRYFRRGVSVFLKTFREAKGMNQDALADELGLSQGIVSEWEQREKGPSREKLEEIVFVLLNAMQGVAFEEWYRFFECMGEIVEEEGVEDGKPGNGGPYA